MSIGLWDKWKVYNLLKNKRMNGTDVKEMSIDNIERIVNSMNTSTLKEAVIEYLLQR